MVYQSSTTTAWWIDEVKEVEQIDFKLTLATLKPIYAKWLVDFGNHMTIPKGEQVISSAWSAAGITNALKKGETCLEPLDLFADIDPLVREPSVEQDGSNILQIGNGLIEHLLSEDEKDSCDWEWEFEDGNIFDVIAHELWFVICTDFLESYFQNTLHWT